jgi:hypothetical protein
MGLGVQEIRDRAERLKSSIENERYQWKAGLKTRPDFQAVYESHALLVGDDVLPAIQRKLAQAEDDEEDRLRSLFSWVAMQRVEARLSPLDDQYRAWESTTAVSINEKEIPLRSVTFAIENEPDRATREHLELRRTAWLEEAVPLQVDTLHREREAVAELGLGGYVEAWERLTRVNLRAMEREAIRVLAATEDLYRDQLAYHLGRLEVDPEAATRSDIRWLRRMRWLDDYFELESTLDVVRKDLGELGLPLTADGRVKLDVERRPGKAIRSFCAPIQVPRNVVLVVAPTGGWPDCAALMHELGHALHMAYTRESIPFEYRALGASAVTEPYALLFELLTLERQWVERTVGLAARELEDYLRLVAFLELYRLRLLAARLIYQLELYRAELPGQMGGRFAEILSGATGVRFDPRTYLMDLARGFWVARKLRAWMLQAILQESLRDRYDADWYRNPAAGPFLGELFSAGQRDDAGELAVQLGQEKLSARPLAAEIGEWFS